MPEDMRWAHFIMHTVIDAEKKKWRSVGTDIRGKELRKLRRKLSLHTPNFNNVGTEKREK